MKVRKGESTEKGTRGKQGTGAITAGNCNGSKKLVIGQYKWGLPPNNHNGLHVLRQGLQSGRRSTKHRCQGRFYWRLGGDGLYRLLEFDPAHGRKDTGVGMGSWGCQGCQGRVTSVPLGDMSGSGDGYGESGCRCCNVGEGLGQEGGWWVPIGWEGP